MSTTNVARRSTFMAKLINRREVAEKSMAFQFERPSEWTFRAGQFVKVTLIEPPETDAEGNVRNFSIASAPHERNLMVTTRMRDTAFKRVLKTAPIQTQVKIEGPFGNLTLHNNAARAAVLLAGGIGITPFRSIVVGAAKGRLAHLIFLFYSNRRPEDAPFLEELQLLERENPNYKFIPTMTKPEGSQQSWRGETGYISHEMISKYVKSVASLTIPDAGPVYYIAGPPAMVAALIAMLAKSGVDDDEIRTEEFVGY